MADDHTTGGSVRLLTVFHTRDECAEEILEIGRRLVAQEEAEPMCQRAQLLQDLDDPARFVHFVEFANTDDLQEFLQADWRREIAAEVLTLLDADPVRYLLGPAGEPAAL